MYNYDLMFKRWKFTGFKFGAGRNRYYQGIWIQLLWFVGEVCEDGREALGLLLEMMVEITLGELISSVYRG